MAETSTTISCRVHGTGVGTSGAAPDITVNIAITFTRNTGSSTVGWTANVSWVDSTNIGRFDYPLYVRMSIDGGNHITLLSKGQTSSSDGSWHAAVSVPNPFTGSFTSTASSTTLAVYIEGQHCYNNGHQCFPDAGDVLIQSYTVALPAYDQTFIIIYDANGGSGGPPSIQTWSLSQGHTNIALETPSWIYIVQYVMSGGSVQSIRRPWNGWKCIAETTPPNGSYFAPLAEFAYQLNCTMQADWKQATFIPDPLPNNSVTVTFNANGGSVSPSSRTVSLTKLGYSTSPSGSVVYEAGVETNINSNLELYPQYNPGMLSSFPTPTKPGYQFGGWYLDSALTQKATVPFGVAENTILYAKWIALPYYKHNGAVWNAQGPYVYKYNGSSWQKTAHLYKYNGTNWIDISEG